MSGLASGGARAGRTAGDHGGREYGMVTAELAIVLPTVILVLALALAALAAATDQLRCVDAARLGARAAARGDAPSDVVEASRRAAPEGAAVTIAGDRTVTVTVTAPARKLAAWLPVPLRPAAVATAPREDGRP